MRITLPRLLLLCIVVAGAAGGVRVVLPAKVHNALGTPAVEIAQPPRASLGIVVHRALTEAEAKALGLSSPRGAAVIRVSPKGAGHAAGIRIEDVIVQFDGKPVAAPQDLAKLVADARPGASVPIGIIRAGKPMTLRASLAEPAPSVSASEPMRKVYIESANIPDETGFGIQFAASTESAPKVEHQPGARIEALLQGGAGERAGLRSGDRIVRVDGTTITTVPQAVSVLKGGDNAIRRVVTVRDDGADPGNERLVFLSKAS